MNSRDTILAAVKASQPAAVALPETIRFADTTATAADFTKVAEGIGAAVYTVTNADILPRVQQLFPEARRIVSVAGLPGTDIELLTAGETDGHTLDDVDVVLMRAAFGVAENGAVWLTEDQYRLRVLPFIGENLVMVLLATEIVATLQQAYDRIADATYGFGAFIAGPSKTADIEQSLVLGAHGPRTMTILLVG